MSYTNECKEVLLRHFGYSDFRKGQLAIINSVLSGRDSLGVLPTGGGKSICFQVPALLRPGITIVISPLISLMQDQTRILKNLDIPAGALYANQDREEKKQIFADIKNSISYLLYLSPERVQKPGFAPWLSQQKVNLVAIDEAHCISQWGPDFRPDYERLSLIHDILPDVPILALTATATPSVLQDMELRLGLKSAERHVYGFYRPNLYYQTEACENDDEKILWVKQALKQNSTGKIIIYCGTRKQTEELTECLQKDFQGVGFYHAGMSGQERTKVQKDYADGALRILVATNAFGMGIDHPDVRLVIQFHLTANIESLYQQMGRAGRDGKKSCCLLLHSKRDYGLQAYFIRTSQARPEIAERRWRSLDSVVQYAEGGECRHAEILTYFKDTERIESCGHCDVCSPEALELITSPEFSELASQTAKKKRVRKTEHSQSLMEEASELYSRIKAWRKDYAKENDIPAFVVFSDKTLIDICNKKPGTSDALLDIKGIGPQKVEKFGSKLLELVQTS